MYSMVTARLQEREQSEEQEEEVELHQSPCMQHVTSSHLYQLVNKEHYRLVSSQSAANLPISAN